MQIYKGALIWDGVMTMRVNSLRNKALKQTTHSGRQLQFIDLFCGCGGFSLGMIRAGMKCLAAIDFDDSAAETFTKNMPEVRHVLKRNLTRFSPHQLAELIGDEQVDIIVGGPPCQGFSTARQRDGANHGKRRLVDDPRRYLYREYLRYVQYFRPRVFVIENVLGIRSAADGEYLTRVQKEARELGYRVHDQIEDARELGVPQKRRRQLFIGVRADLPRYFIPELKPAPRAILPSCCGGRQQRDMSDGQPALWDAIGDLPSLQAGQGNPETDYNLERRRDHIERRGSAAKNYLLRVLEIDRAEKLHNHIARPHSERDLRDFARLREGENSATAMRDRGVQFEFPYDTSSFKDRYTRQSRWQPCSTIVAHLSKDGLMFIHPTQNRSLTPREAARIQSFPDWFVFPAARTHAFRLIGNAVPPLVAEAVGLAIKEYLKAGPDEQGLAVAALAESFKRNTSSNTFDKRCAVVLELEKLAQLDSRALRELPTDELLRGWYALLFLFPDLHPNNARNHGKDMEESVSRRSSLESYGKLSARRYARSGWPVALELIGREAWRRYEAGEYGRSIIYCNPHQATECESIM